MTKFFVLASILCAFILGACSSAPDALNPPATPIVSIFTGGLYNYGGATVDLNFSVTQPTGQSTALTGSLALGWDLGFFTINPGLGDSFSITGATERCASHTAEGACASGSTKKDVLNFGLQVSDSIGITGASPSATDPLVWNLKRSVNGKVITWAGTLTATDGLHDMEVTINEDGSLDGKLFNFHGQTLVLNGYIAPDAQVKVPPSAIATLLLIAAIDQRS